MIDNIVTLVVKAPNLQISDQTVECPSLFSVKQLKEHLSDVYPTKPKIEEQKIIYSGQLLDDKIVLKDVLRAYEIGQTSHTVHLVCTPSRLKQEPRLRDEGLRRRTVSQPAESSTSAAAASSTETSQNNNNTLPTHNAFVNFMNSQQNVAFASTSSQNMENMAMLNHMTAMQQAYMQYMQQYAAMWQAAMANNPALATSWAQGVPMVGPQGPNNPQTFQDLRNMYNQAQPNQPGEQQAPVANVQNPNDLNEEGNEIDILETLYRGSRLMLLGSLLYFYSSPLRFALVFLLGFWLYLYEVGFFGNVNQQNVRQNHPEPPVREPAPAEQERQEPGAVDDTPQRPPEPQTNVEEPQQSVFAVTWMIVTSFITSLLPDGPNAI